MADGSSGAGAQIAALYGLPRDEFTPARNQLAQQLRRAGERELGEQVKRLRKPSVAAWTLNQVRWRHPEQVEGLLAAGQRLREAQERLLEEGERGRLRDAAADERRLVEETVQAAEAILEEAGETVRPPLHNKLWETAHAAALDPELGETLGRGRLLQDLQISDLGLIGGVGSAPAASTVGAEPAPPKPTPKTQRRREQARQRKQKAQSKLETALRAASEAENRLALAQEQLQGARTAATRAQADAERARSAVDQAREQVQQASDRLDVLEANE